MHKMSYRLTGVDLEQEPRCHRASPRRDADAPRGPDEEDVGLIELDRLHVLDIPKALEAAGPALVRRRALAVPVATELAGRQLLRG
jgi:hypothetical protein